MFENPCFYTQLPMKESHCVFKLCWPFQSKQSTSILNYSGDEVEIFRENKFDTTTVHDDVIKGKLFPCYWPFMRGIPRSPVNSPHKGQWRGALMFSLICVWINGWVNNRETGDLRRYRARYDVIVMSCLDFWCRHVIYSHDIEYAK